MPPDARFVPPEELPAGVRAILVDPEDHGPLIWISEEGVYRNERLDRDFPVRDGIPLLHLPAAIPRE